MKRCWILVGLILIGVPGILAGPDTNLLVKADDKLDPRKAEKDGSGIMNKNDKKAADGICIGTAATNITPPVGTLLIGFASRRAKGVGHQLRAEALACRQGERGWVLITTDTVGYTADYTAEVRQRIRKLTGLPAEAVMLSSTHTHSGPATSIGEGKENDLDLRYLDELKDRLAAVADKAWRAAVPARFESASTNSSELISNRRVQAPDGTWRNEWTDPKGTHPGFVDPTLLVVGVRPAGAKQLSGLLVNYGCHPITLGPKSLEISSDYPGYLKDAIETNLPACTAMFALAGGGDIDPRVCIMAGSQYPRRMGESLAKTVLGAVPGLKPIGEGPIGYASEPWEMIRTKDEPGPIGKTAGRKGDKISSEVQAFRAGNLMVVGIPGELFCEFCPMLRKVNPDLVTVVVSLANDYLGYLTTDEAQRQGAMEPKWAPIEELEKPLVERATAAMNAAMK